MKAFQIIFIIVLIIPFAEIYLLLQVGGIIGAFPTIFLVVFTAVLGSWLLKQQGFATLQRFQASLAQGTLPAYELLEGVLILLGGALLLTPGFITDMIGFACLIPQLRGKIVKYVVDNKLIQTIHPFQPAKAAEKDVLEGEFRKED
ncbi:FxsA cytoplasmic membrane protein [Crenothrix polyspora]|uniref:FxsA cytoplasmic membrane protein n=1 Tax=Crenothrix polyspora TaxID=360316 RepID=A0A1R4HA22_9GAMM|nr:FxsA family protein [Crenothrix polyspora]SJM93063.1 FxsA cytoplasmic membrane protein [Crenothrix polyspora]